MTSTRGTFLVCAFLLAHNGNPAAAEFQKIVDHPGVVVNEEIGALARLGLGGAYALAGDKGKRKLQIATSSRCGGMQMLTLPILKQAGAEYQKLE